MFKKQIVEESIGKGIQFLESSQLESGEFPTFVSRSQTLLGDYHLSPFVTTLDIHALNVAGRERKFSQLTSKPIKRGLDFLLSQMESPGMWMYFGKNSWAPPDLDCTTCSLSALLKNGVSLEYENIADYMLSFRDTTGIFNTWAELPRALIKNEIEPIVNANILYFYSSIGRELPKVSDYLNDSLNRLPFKSNYYISPYSLVYFVSRAYTDGNARGLDLTSLKEFSSRLSDISKSNSKIDAAIRVISGLDFGDDHRKLEEDISYIVSSQRGGGWPYEPFFFTNNMVYWPGKKVKGVSLYFGSKSLTSAFCLEALAKLYTKL